MLNCNSPEVRVSGLDILKPAWSEYLPSFTWGTLRWIYLAYSSQVILKISCGPQVVTRLAKARQAELGRETAPHQELSILTPTCGICHSLPHAPTVYHTYSYYTVQDPECKWSRVNIYIYMNQLSSLGISGQAESVYEWKHPIVRTRRALWPPTGTGNRTWRSHRDITDSLW